MGTITLTQPVDLSGLMTLGPATSFFKSVGWDKALTTATFDLQFGAQTVEATVKFAPGYIEIGKPGEIPYSLQFFLPTMNHFEEIDLSNGVKLEGYFAFGLNISDVLRGEANTIIGSGGDDTFLQFDSYNGSRWLGGGGNDNFILRWQDGGPTESVSHFIDGGNSGSNEINTLSIWSYFDLTSWDIRNINRFTFDWSSNVTLSNTQIKAGYISPGAAFDGAHAPSINIILSDSSILDFSTLQFTNWNAAGYNSAINFSLAPSFTPSSLNLVLTSVGDHFEGGSMSGPVTVAGGGGDDQITGGSGNNTLSGDAGNDTLNAWSTNGNNILTGGDGNDFIGVSGSSINTITGGAGDDSISFSGAGNGVITGGDGNDYISGDGNSSLNGNSTGNYAIDGGAGNDYVESGEGNDTITGGSGRNHLSGGVGDDLFIAGSGIDKMSGDDGNDLFIFAAGSVQAGDAVFGGVLDTQDTIQISADLDLRPLTIFGVTTLDLEGNTATVSMRQVKNSAVDEIKSSVAGGELVVVGNANLSNVAIADDVAVTMNGSDGDGANTLVGGTHDEIINGLGGNDTLLGNEGDDVLNGGAGGDKIYGGDGDDTILLSADDVVAGEKWWGGFSDDTVKLLSSTDASAVSGISSVETVDLNGFAGTFLGSRFGAGKIENVASAPAGAELITIGKADLSGVDVSAGIKVTLNGAAGNVNDVITGASVAAAINGLDGNDTLKGLAGADTIAGGAGQDLLIGGLGKDNLTGGAGADVFDFDSVADSAKGVAVRDTIIDFSRVEGDKIDLSNIDASAAAAGDQAFSFLGSSAFSGVAGQLRYAAGVLMADVNGDKVADLEISLANKFALKVGDFVL